MHDPLTEGKSQQGGEQNRPCCQPRNSSHTNI